MNEENDCGHVETGNLKAVLEDMQEILAERRHKPDRYIAKRANGTKWIDGRRLSTIRDEWESPAHD